MKTPILLAIAASLAFAAPVSVQAQQPRTIAYLVRHAEKGADGGTDPHLAPAGTARAHALEAVLRDSGLTTIVVTPWYRTRETAQPLLASRPVPLITIPVAASTLAVYADSVARIVAGATGPVLVIGHSNTIPAVIAALGGPRDIIVCEAQYADLFIIRRAKRDSPVSVTRSRYGAPDPPGADRCP